MTVPDADVDTDAAVVQRFATLGDSITAGTPLDSGRLWPALVTDWLATHSPDVRHVNLAVGGALSRDLLSDQTPKALECRADLVTVICGANDVLHSPRPDIDFAGASLTECLRRLAEEIPLGRVVTATYPDFVPLLPFRPRSRARVTTGLSRLNEAIRAAASAVDVLCVDLASMSRHYSNEVYAPDGAHPSQIGHEWIAVAMSVALASQLKWPDALSYWQTRASSAAEPEMRMDRSLELPDGVIPL
jgi:lysophospholipase L1-like esterase